VSTVLVLVAPIGDLFCEPVHEANRGEREKARPESGQKI
jgi:hypothetical protein